MNRLCSFLERSTVVLVGTMLSILPASAQDMDQTIDQNFQAMSLYAGSIPIEYEAKRSFSRSVNAASAKPRCGHAPALASNGKARAASMRMDDLRYSPTPTIRKVAMETFLARLRQKNGAHADVAATEFAKHDYAQVWRGIVPRFGLSENDAGDTLTAYLILGWMIVHGAADPSPADVQGARTQIGASLSRDNHFINQSDRAALGEEFKILFVTLHSGWQSAQREGTLARFRRDVSRVMLEQSGIDLSSVSLGCSGFVARSGGSLKSRR